MDKKFYNKIIKLIPSNTLKDFLKGSKFEFKEKDLLAIIDDYSRNYEEKLALLREAANCIEDKAVALHAKKLIELHTKHYDDFMQPNDDCAYEIVIIDNDFSHQGRFITKTFEDAITLIKNYKKYYGDDYVTKEKTYTAIDGYYKIFKCTTIAPKKPSDFSNKVGQIGVCLLAKNLQILDVDMYNYGVEDAYRCKRNCDDCKNKCIMLHCPKFPAFLEQYQLVAFKWDKIIYGIMPFEMEDGDNDTYIIDLEDNDFIVNREKLKGLDDYRIFDAHMHPSFFELYIPNRQDVLDKIYENYLYAVKVLKELGCNGDGFGYGFED